MDTNVTSIILKIFILEVHQGIQVYAPRNFLSYMSKCEIDTVDSLANGPRHPQGLHLVAYLIYNM